MKLALTLLCCLLATPALAAKSSYRCQELKPKFGPATKALRLQRLTHGGVPDGFPVRYQLVLTEGNELLYSAVAVARQDPAVLAFKVPGYRVSGRLSFDKLDQSELRWGARKLGFACRVN